MKELVLARDRQHILERTLSLWEPLRGARIFMTGGTGFVGTWLSEAFVAANQSFQLDAHLVLLTRDPVPFRTRSPHLATDPGISFIVGDVATFEPPAGTFKFIIHAATERRFDATLEYPLAMLELDMQATRRVLDLAAKNETERLLFTSSGAVYGSRATTLERIPETYEGAPDVMESRAAYGESKRLSEYACASYGRVFGFDAVIARLFAFIGPHFPLDEGYAVGNFVNDVLARRPIAISGDGTPRRSYLYAADLAIWLWTLLLRGDGGRAYNVGSPHPVSIKQLADTVAATLSPETPVTVAHAAAMGATPSHYVPDTTRAQSELGLRPWVGLPDALQRMYDFYSQPWRTTTTL